MSIELGLSERQPFPLQVVREKYKSFYARKKKQSAERAYIMEKQKKTWNKIIGENIRRLRISHNETQAELGESIGYGSTTIANYESGERLPDLITAYAIAQRYHVEMEKLMEEDFTNREYKEN